MRSRSSVLSHILGSNPGVCGYSEQSVSHRDRASLIKMRYKLSREMEYKLKNKYLLDKILHDDYFISDKIFKIAKPKIIFLLREPESTIKSIIHMGYITGIDWYKDPVQAMDYYCARLSGMEEYSRKARGKYYFVESNDLVDKAESVLDGLTKWLDLPERLSRKYSIFRHTGKPRHGDPSENIKSGVLQKTKDYPDILIPDEILQRGLLSYKKCRDTLQSGRVI